VPGTLIRHGRVITASDDCAADVLMQDGIVRAIGRGLAVGDDVAVVDATGLYVLPGGLDVEKVFPRGESIVDGWLGHEGMGRFVPRGDVKAF